MQITMRPPALLAFLLSAVTAAAAVTLAVNSSVSDGSNGTVQLDIRMKGAHPSVPDDYICAGYNLTQDEAYIVKFEGLASADTAHHILLYGCQDGPASSEDFWECGSICDGGRQIMFAWAKNAPPTQLPQGVGMKIGRQSAIKAIVVQIHYARAFAANETPDHSGIRLFLSQKQPRYSAGVFLLLPYGFSIPSNHTKYHVDVSCAYTLNYTIFPFAFRTHAHNLGRVIVGYQYNQTGYHQIGKGNPQWPQAFYPSNTSVVIRPGDYLVARCTYNSEGVNHTVNVGSTGDDEMCNFYFMFFTEGSVGDPPVCAGVENQDLVTRMPADSDVPLPPNPALEAQAKGHHRYHSPHPHPQVPVTPPHPPTTPQTPVTPATVTTTTVKAPVTTTTMKAPIAPATVATTTAKAPVATTAVPSPVKAGSLSGQLTYQKDWAPHGLDIGQVGGVATDSDGNLYIFHRGHRIWEGTSFDANNNFQLKKQPIQNDTVLILSPDGRLIRKFGMGRHFMPHGITVDKDNNIWLTDVALHQVFRIPSGATIANLILGTRFVPGNDDKHFCKPTDVAVLPSGEFFVSDGYCNSRVLKFSKEGQLLKQWGQPSTGVSPGPGQFLIAHSVTVSPDLVFVADRENARIQCFDLDGNFKFIIQHPQFGAALYAVEYCPMDGGLLFAVNGGSGGDFKGFTFALPSNTLLATWTPPSPQRLTSPHDVAVDMKGHAVYVGELNPSAVRKFIASAATSSGVSPTTTTTTTTTRTTTTTHHPVPTVPPVSGNGAEGAATAGSGVKDQDKVKILGTERPLTPMQQDGGSAEGASMPNKTVGKEGGLGVSGKSVVKGEGGSVTPMLLVGPLLAIPIMLVMTIIAARICKDRHSCAKAMRNGTPGSRKGFDPLLQSVSEDSESENEMFLQPSRKRK